MNLCGITACQHECRTEQLGLYFVHLFLRLKYGIDKFLVRKFPTEMPLGNFVRYVIFLMFSKHSSPTFVQICRDRLR